VYRRLLPSVDRILEYYRRALKNRKAGYLQRVPYLDAPDRRGAFHAQTAATILKKERSLRAKKGHYPTHALPMADRAGTHKAHQAIDLPKRQRFGRSGAWREDTEICQGRHE
jgi:hypothetical protein